jgi:hypothetical protein
VNQLGRVLIMMGLALVVVGALVLVGDRIGLGRLPGDITWRKKGVSIHFPIMTSIVVSIVLTLILNLWFRRR